jgi:hypothetical protein
LSQDERLKLSSVRDAVEAAAKRRRNCNSGFSEATFVPFWLSLRAGFRISRYFEFSGGKTCDLILQHLGSDLYNAGMSNNSEVLILSNGSSGSVIAAPEPTPQFLLNACCLWCDRTFSPRMTGGSAQRFCCTAHRQQFWIAARRWTIRAIEAGLLSVDCLKASHASVHAA